MVLDNIAPLFRMCTFFLCSCCSVHVCSIKDFQDSCDVQADGGKKNSLSVSYSVGQVKVDLSWYLTSCKV